MIVPITVRAKVTWARFMKVPVSNSLKQKSRLTLLQNSTQSNCMVEETGSFSISDPNLGRLHFVTVSQQIRVNNFTLVQVYSYPSGFTLGIMYQ